MNLTRNSLPKQYSFISIVICLGLSLGLALQSGSVRGQNLGQTLTPIPTVLAAPSFDLLDLNDERHTLDNYLGKPLIVNFWATWCPPCRKEMPSMERAWQKLKVDGINMIGINVGEDFDAVFGFTGEVEVNFPLLLDTDNQATEKWPIRALPTTYILDAKGRIVYQALGERDWEDETILNQVRALLNDET